MIAAQLTDRQTGRDVLIFIGQLHYCHAIVALMNQPGHVFRATKLAIAPTIHGTKAAAILFGDLERHQGVGLLCTLAIGSHPEGVVSG